MIGQGALVRKDFFKKNIAFQIAWGVKKKNNGIILQGQELKNKNKVGR